MLASTFCLPQLQTFTISITTSGPTSRRTADLLPKDFATAWCIDKLFCRAHREVKGQSETFAFDFLGL